MTQETLDAFERLSDILDTLRQQCPWDRVQTLGSLRYLTIEETYELSEAVLKVTQGAEGSPSSTAQNAADTEFKKELGDLFMHLLFYSKIAEEEGRFTTADVFNAISDKLVDRHPFIYRKDDYEGESWEQIKMHEGRKSVLEGVPPSLPPLVKAVRLQEKAAGIGYSPSVSPSCPLDETTDETQFGNLLFDLVRWAHDHHINADDALSKANLRFQQQVRQFEDDTSRKTDQHGAGE
ncbi:MAG: nucleoside triphosphate pyrophosphohydrolase [Bacteroidales bacterium]|nr:nucleoside triphosphate pyrophosphohydrolase [Bacteroidales bacterium]